MFGKLIFTDSCGRPMAMWMLASGSSLVANLNGQDFTVMLEEFTPNPQKALDSLSTAQIADYLARRIREEENEREQEALDSRRYEE